MDRKMWMGILAITLIVYALVTPCWIMAQDDTEIAEEGSDEKAVTVEDITMWQMLKDSGLVGLVICLLSVAAMALAIEHFVTLQRDKLIPPDMLQDIEELFEDENYEDVMETCTAEPGYLTNVIAAALPRIKAGYPSMMEAVASANEEESVKLQQKISWLQLIGAIAPMLGLLGTVTGMVSAFNKIASMKDVSPKPADLASGIRQALLTTVEGLIVAIPCIVCYFYFRNKVVKISMEISGVTEELLERFREK